jgi:hypothetical protein
MTNDVLVSYNFCYMKNISAKLKRITMAVGIMIVATLVSISTGGAWESKAFSNVGSDAYAHGDLITDHWGDASLQSGTKLTIPLSGSLSLDLNLSSVDIGQPITGADPLGASTIPPTKPGPYRLGAGVSFRF